MPKIIEDIEKRILDSAIELFESMGYEQVDMRMIAKNAGIAVGTLYNYVSGKKELFWRAFEISWQETLDNLDSIGDTSVPAREKLRMSVEELYDGVSKRTGMAQKFFEVNLAELGQKLEKNKQSIESSMRAVQNEVATKLETLLVEVAQDGSPLDSGMLRRFSRSIIALIRNVLVEYPEEHDSNLQYLNCLVDLATRRDNNGQ